MSAFKQIFEAYGGDYATTMGRFMGNETMYLKLLDMLFKDENLQRMKQALAEQDCAAAFEAAHTLKGVVGNMGLAPLYEKVCAIVEPLRAGQQRDYTADYREIEREFARADELRGRLKGGGTK